MAKKGGGNKGTGGGNRSFSNNPFGGLFDLNNDGKEDLSEQWLALKIFEECTREEKAQHDCTCDPILDDDIDGSWREFCEDGSEFGLYAWNYETKEEYEEALAKAKKTGSWRELSEEGFEFGLYSWNYKTKEEYAEAIAKAKKTVSWRNTCEDGSKYGLSPKDFGSKYEYDKALEEAKDKEREDASAPSISLRFSLKFPALDRLNEIREEDYPNKRRFRAAHTLANEFIFYGDKEDEQREKACCQFIIESADKITAANYLTHNGSFLYAQAIKDNFKLPVSLPDEDECREYEFSEALCKIAKRDVALSFEVWEWCMATFLPYAQYANDSKAELTSSVIDDLYNFPENYETELAKYMDSHPDFLQKFVDEDIEMSIDLDRLIFAALEAGLMGTALALFKGGLKQAGDDWEEINILTNSTISWCKNYDESETAEYFKLNMLPLVKAIDIGMVQDEIDEWEKGLNEYISQFGDNCEREEQKQEQRIEAEEAVAEDIAEDISDDKIYTFCGVLFPHAQSPYYYRTDDPTIKVGDDVLVPAGDKETTGKVVSVGQYMRVAAPYPVSKTKFIIRKLGSE